MHDLPQSIPAQLEKIEAETQQIGFDMPSERRTGSILRTLAATKPNSHLLELGTGTGLSAAWILDGMDQNSHLTSIELSPDVEAIAQNNLGHDARLNIIIADGNDWLTSNQDTFDFVFADAMPGKYENFDLAWALLKVGEIYICDDMLPQPNWPDGHQANVDALLTKFENMPDCILTKLAWATGICIVVKIT